MGVLYFSLVSLSYGFSGIYKIFSSTLNAMGKPYLPTLMIVIQMFGLYIPLAFIGSHFWGLSGIFGAAMISICVIGMISFYWMKGMKIFD